MLFSGLEVQYGSRVGTLSGGHAPAYWIANLTLFSRNLLKNLEASASIYNVFDRHIFYPAAGEHLQDVIEQDGRTFRVKLTYHF